MAWGTEETKSGMLKSCGSSSKTSFDFFRPTPNSGVVLVKLVAALGLALILVKELVEERFSLSSKPLLATFSSNLAKLLLRTLRLRLLRPSFDPELLGPLCSGESPIKSTFSFIRSTWEIFFLERPKGSDRPPELRNIVTESAGYELAVVYCNDLTIWNIRNHFLQEKLNRLRRQ